MVFWKRFHHSVTDVLCVFGTEVSVYLHSPQVQLTIPHTAVKAINVQVRDWELSGKIRNHWIYYNQSQCTFTSQIMQKLKKVHRNWEGAAH